MAEFTLRLTDAELEALKGAFPDLAPDDAAAALIRAEMQRRYKRELQAGRLVRFQALKEPRGAA